MAAELRLDMRTDGYVRVGDLLRLNLQTFAKVSLKSHTVDEIREVIPHSERVINLPGYCYLAPNLLLGPPTFCKVLLIVQFSVNCEWLLFSLMRKLVLPVCMCRR
jgi:uncharacterized membrane protein